jgi:hypothetical protein
MGCDEATYLAAVLIFIEVIHRCVQNPPDDFQTPVPQYVTEFAYAKSYVFLAFFVLSMTSTALFVWKLHTLSIFKNYAVQQSLPYLYMIDSIGAICLGYSMYYRNVWGMVGAMTLLTNFLMLHVLHGVFSGKGHNDMVRSRTHTMLWIFSLPVPFPFPLGRRADGNAQGLHTPQLILLLRRQQ